MRRSPEWVLAAICALVLLALLGCGDDNKSTAPAEVDFTGTWSVTETTDGTDCDEGITVDSYVVTAQQTGSTVVVFTQDGTFSGSVSGREVTWNSDVTGDGGWTVSIVTLTFFEDGNSFTGSSTWTWTGGNESCSGSSTLNGSRLSSLAI